MTAAVVVPALRAILEEDAPSEKALRAALRAHPELDADLRAAVARRVLGPTALRARLAFLLEAAGLRPSPSSLVAAYARLEEGLPPEDAARAGGLEEEEARLLERLDPARAPWPADPIARLSLQASLPAWIARAFVEDLGIDEARRLSQALNRPGPVVLRANTLRVDRARLLEELAAEGVQARPTTRSPWGILVEQRANLFGLQAWRRGRFEVQDEGSQLIALAAGARPGQLVVDLCAGRGGKSLALAASMDDEGRLVCFDVDPAALRDLDVRRRRAEVACLDVLSAGDEAALASLLGRADVVLVDAPCSSLGTLRRGPDRRWRLREDEALALPALQLSLLRRARALLAPGGRLVYATCTLRRQENDEVADRILEEGALEPAPLFAGAPGGALPDGARATLLPHRDQTDGFFLAAFRRA